MGLAERKEVEAFKNNKFDSLKQKIAAAAGFDVPVEVDWNSFAVEGQAHNYATSFGPVFFEPTIKAFKNVANDDMGKQALKDGLKKIIMKNDEPGAYGTFTFESGVLTINHNPVSNVGDVDGRAGQIQEVLESSL